MPVQASLSPTKKGLLMLRKFLLLASTFATLAATAALPAGATTVTFTLSAGALSISAPAGSLPLGSPQVASTSSHTFSGLLGTVTVTDDRGGGTAWVASVISTAFTPDNAAAAVPALNVGYVPGTVTVSALVVATKPVTTDLTGVSPVVNGASTGLSTASWNPTITVLAPANSAPGIYSGTITHSVA
jgi:hypothetical protein